MPIFVLNWALTISFGIAFYLAIDSYFPIFLGDRRRNRVNFAKNTPCLQTIFILPCTGIAGDDLICIRAVDPALYRVYAFFTEAKFNRLTHRYTQ